jgi:hypothetical protein
LAGVIPKRRTRHVELPAFENIRIPDQLDLKCDAFLLVSPHSMAGKSKIWEIVRKQMKTDMCDREVEAGNSFELGDYCQLLPR